MINYIIFGIYNLIYQILTICILFFANTFLNWFFIPKSLQWQSNKEKVDLTGQMIIQTAVLLIEAALLMMIIYYINKWFLYHIVKASNYKTIALWTVGVSYAILIILILTTTYLNNR